MKRTWWKWSVQLPASKGSRRFSSCPSGPWDDHAMKKPGLKTHGEAQLCHWGPPVYEAILDHQPLRVKTSERAMNRPRCGKLAGVVCQAGKACLTLADVLLNSFPKSSDPFITPPIINNVRGFQLLCATANTRYYQSVFFTFSHSGRFIVVPHYGVFYFVFLF